MSTTPRRSSAIIREGLEELGLRPFGRTLVKPNLVAAGPLFPYAYTRPEFGEGVLRALRDVGGSNDRPSSRPASAAASPCRRRVAFRESGWDAMLRAGRIKQLPLRGRAAGRDPAHAPEPAARLPVHARADRARRLLRQLPQVQGAPVDHGDVLAEELHRHPGRSPPPDRSRSQAQREDRGPPAHHPAAVHRDRRHHRRRGPDADADAVRSRPDHHGQQPGRVRCGVLLDHRVDPRSVDHIRLSAEHGFGITDLAKIDITGDVTLEEARARAKGFKVGLIRVEKYFEGTHISAYAGPPPEPEHGDYCWGGCPGAIEEAIEILRVFDKTTDEQHARTCTSCSARTTARSLPSPARSVVFIGDCAEWKGQLHGKVVEIPNIYKDRATHDPHTATQQDIFAKLATARGKLTGDVIRLEGCPVSVAEQVLALVSDRQAQESVLRSEEHGAVRPRVLRLEGARRAQPALSASATSRTGASRSVAKPHRSSPRREEAPRDRTRLVALASHQPPEAAHPRVYPRAAATRETPRPAARPGVRPRT